MSWQNKLEQWRNESEERKQQLSVTAAVIGTGLIFLIWLVVIAFDLSTPTPVLKEEKSPVAVQVVSTPDQEIERSWWDSLSAGSVEAVLSIWQGLKITADKITN